MVLAQAGKNAIPPVPGFLQTAGLEAQANAFRGIIGFVDGEMAPPGSPVVPKVVILVLGIHPHAEFGCWKSRSSLIGLNDCLIHDS